MGEEDGRTSCGLGSWRPSWLQRFASRQVKTSPNPKVIISQVVVLHQVVVDLDTKKTNTTSLAVLLALPSLDVGLHSHTRTFLF